MKSSALIQFKGEPEIEKFGEPGEPPALLFGNQVRQLLGKVARHKNNTARALRQRGLCPVGWYHKFLVYRRADILRVKADHPSTGRDVETGMYLGQVASYLGISLREATTYEKDWLKHDSHFLPRVTRTAPFYSLKSIHRLHRALVGVYGPTIRTMGRSTLETNPLQLEPPSVKTESEQDPGSPGQNAETPVLTAPRVLTPSLQKFQTWEKKKARKLLTRNQFLQLPEIKKFGEPGEPPEMLNTRQTAQLLGLSSTFSPTSFPQRFAPLSLSPVGRWVTSFIYRRADVLKIKAEYPLVGIARETGMFMAQILDYTGRSLVEVEKSRERGWLNRDPHFPGSGDTACTLYRLENVQRLYLIFGGTEKLPSGAVHPFLPQVGDSAPKPKTPKITAKVSPDSEPGTDAGTLDSGKLFPEVKEYGASNYEHLITKFNLDMQIGSETRLTMTQLCARTGLTLGMVCHLVFYCGLPEHLRTPHSTTGRFEVHEVRAAVRRCTLTLDGNIPEERPVTVTELCAVTGRTASTITYRIERYGTPIVHTRAASTRQLGTATTHGIARDIVYHYAEQDAKRLASEAKPEPSVVPDAVPAKADIPVAPIVEPEPESHKEAPAVDWMPPPPSGNTFEPFIGLSAAAEFLGIASEEKVLALVAAGYIPAYKADDLHLFRKSELVAAFKNPKGE